MKLVILSILVLRAEKCTTFGSYLQHFETKFGSFTNLRMFFKAIMIDFVLLVWIKIWCKIAAVLHYAKYCGTVYVDLVQVRLSRG
jgi:hypothetical protein